MLDGGCHAAAVSGAWPRPARPVGHHVLIREIGRGGMGCVYLARDVRLDREVAIKFVAVDGPAATQRFIAEARVTARCKHPNIVDIYEIDDVDDHPYMVLEYVEGESVQALLARGPVAPEPALAIMTQVARGLAFAHSRSIIHRDLKPANILVTAGGVAKIVDFGIARPFDDAVVPVGDGDQRDLPPRDLTGAGELPGTLHYLAPEQVRRDPVDDRVDLWAFGVTFYELVSGRRPLAGLARSEVLTELDNLDHEVPRLDAVAPALPAALVDVVHRCLEKRVELRMGSASELVAALEALATTLTALAEVAPRDPTPTAPDPTPPRLLAPAPRPRRRASRLLTVLVGLAVLAAVGLAAKIRRADRGRAGPAALDDRAQARVAALIAELDRLDGQDARADGDRLLDDFLGDERAPDSLALGWLARGDRERARAGDDSDAVLASYATAFAHAVDRGVQRRALLAVAGIYLERLEWDRLAAALEVLAEVAGPDDADVVALRDRWQLAVRAGGGAAGSISARIADALLVGRSTGLALTDTTTVDVDGDGTLELLAIEGEALVVRTAATLAEVTRLPLDGARQLRCAGRDARGGYAVVSLRRQPIDFVLVPLDGGPRRAIDPDGSLRMGRCRWIDLDGVGGAELYVMADASLVRMTRTAGSDWRRDVLPIGSQVWDAIGGDLDGDGRRELVLSVGQWRGYEVRLLRAGPDGTLALVDRLRLGVVAALADLGRDRDRHARLAAIKIDVYPNVRDLPADQPLGDPAGLYVLGLTGDHLAIEQRIDLPGLSSDASQLLARRYFPALGPVLVTDVDGDGRVDVLADVELTPERPNLLVMLGAADGGFAARLLGGVALHAVVPGAGADQLVANIEGEATTWILGGGAVAIPRRAVGTPAGPAPSPALGLDSPGAAAWRRGEQLARIGQVQAAADALRRIATLTAVPSVKVAALRRAAALLTAGGLSAAATLEAIAALPSLDEAARIEAWLAALDDDLAHGALLEGLDRATRLRASALPRSPADEARLHELELQLPSPPRAVFGGAGLDPAWRIVDPSLVQVDAGANQLVVETLTPGVVAALALTTGGRGVVVTIDAEVTRMEWASNLHVRLAPRDPTRPGAIEIELGARGGGRFYRRGYRCGGTYPSNGERYDALPDSDAKVAVRLELALLPGGRRGRCTVTAEGRVLTVDLDAAVEPVTDWTLTIGATTLASMTSATARITSIELAGAAVVAAPATLLDEAAVALANHRAHDASALLARLDRATAASWPAIRLAVIAAGELGDRRAAAAALAASRGGPVAARPTLRELASLARARDGQFMPIVRAGFGARAAILLDAAWSSTAHHELVQPRVRAALLRDLDDLPPTTPATVAPTVSLLGYLGEAMLAAGRPDEARRSLSQALALVPPSADVELRDRGERIAYLLAADAAARGDEPAALRWALASLDLSNYPEAAADRLLLDPAVRALAHGPGWERVPLLGRTLAPPP